MQLTRPRNVYCLVPDKTLGSMAGDCFIEFAGQAQTGCRVRVVVGGTKRIPSKYTPYTLSIYFRESPYEHCGPS